MGTDRTQVMGSGYTEMKMKIKSTKHKRRR